LGSFSSHSLLVAELYVYELGLYITGTQL